MILLIDNYDSFTHNLYQQLAVVGEGRTVKVVRNDQLTLASIAKEQPQAIVVSPGPSTPESAGISVAIFQKFAGKIPLLGVCLGMQAMAVAFGATVSRAKIPMHGKASWIWHQQTGLFQGLPQPFEVGRYHSLEVEPATLPAELRIDAHLKGGEIMALSHRSYPCYGVQFHPESLLTPKGGDLVQNFFDQL